jgi:SAM-dependent methyltransferase
MSTGIVVAAKALARPLVHRFRRVRDRVLLRSVHFNGSSPLSSASGFDRGTPIDRFYIEQFLASHASDIHGRVLEVGEDKYSRRFGGDRVTRQGILHVDGSNASATIIGDLSDPDILPRESFDCILITQTLQYVFDLGAALGNLRSALRPGGIALITVPGIAPVSIDDWKDSYYWRFTPAAVDRLLAESFGYGNFSISAGGNLFAATGFLHGAAVEELPREKLEPVMDDYAIVVMARAVRQP